MTASGADFVVTGLGRTYRSNECWEQMPGLTAQSHSASPTQVRTSCAMPAGDPRKASIVTTWAVRENALYLDETGQYQFVVEGSNCTASVRRTRVLTRIVTPTAEPASPAASAAVASEITTTKAAEPSPPPAPVAPLTPPSAARCATPGAAVLLEVSPRLKLMRAGESFAFRATARDAAGCRVPVTPSWSLIEGAALGELGAPGALTVAAGAPSGRITLRATLGERTVDVHARVVSHDEFERLLEGGEYGVAGESVEAAEVALPSGVLDVSAPRDTSETAADGERGWLLMGLLGASLLAGAVALFFVLRRTRLGQSLFPPSLPPGESLTPPVAIPPAPRVPSWEQATPPHEPHAPVAASISGKVCPACGKSYGAESTFCGQDGARLVRAN